MKKLKKIIGWAMITSPFIALFIFMTLDSSIWVALSIWGGVIVLAVFLWVGMVLVSDDCEINETE